MRLTIVSALIAMILTLISGVPYLQFLKKRLYGQFIREEAPTSHTVKAGTPTMGGLIIIIPALIAALLSLVMDQKTNTEALIVLISLVLFTFIGFKDDISKIMQQQNKGLSARAKFLIQITAALVPALFITFSGKTIVSVFDYFSFDLGIFYPVFAVLVIVGASNAVNLTDGLDGLASGTSFFAFGALAVIFTFMGRHDLAIIAAAMAGSCLGFLYFNKHPAQVFMGDTGSLALGGILGTLAVVGKVEFWLIPIGIIFIAETLSVILQVISFKTTGKRIFKMSPIHHHFELSGWSEKKVVTVFCITGAVFAVIACVAAYQQMG